MYNIPRKVWQGIVGGRVKVLARSPIVHIVVVPQAIFWMGRAHRLMFYKLLRKIVGSDVQGAVVELGCAFGNTSAFIAKTLRRFKSNREFHVYDSFRGMPAPTEEDGENNMLKEGGICVPRELFEKNFLQLSGRCALPVIHEGWFKDILPQELPEHISFAYVDGDFYESILCSLTHIYPRLSPGAVVYIDDYRHPRLHGVAKAVDEFLKDKPEEIVFLPSCPWYPDREKTQGYFIKQ